MRYRKLKEENVSYVTLLLSIFLHSDTCKTRVYQQMESTQYTNNFKLPIILLAMIIIFKTKISEYQTRRSLHGRRFEKKNEQNIVKNF